MINGEKRARLYQTYLWAVIAFLFLTEITGQIIQYVLSCP